jgi:membrane-associated phospholipid phosphatase
MSGKEYSSSKSRNVDSAGESRRKFLRQIGGAAGAAVAAGAVGVPAISLIGGKQASAAEIGPQSGTQRADSAYDVRQQAALDQRQRPLPAHPTNGDEELYPSKIGNYSKALPHSSLGEVVITAYNSLTHALTTGNPADFEAIILGGTDKLTSPQAAYAFELEGADSLAVATPPPPALSSEAEGGEMAENYWMALTRDIPFSHYALNPLATAAAGELSQFSNYSDVTAASLFRGPWPGDQVGPYVSQFLWKDYPAGAAAPLVVVPSVQQRYRVPVPAKDFLTSYGEWLNVQNGKAPSEAITFDPAARYIRNGRDLSEFVHIDYSFQAFLHAALILMSYGNEALDDNHPYKNSRTQKGFVTFGGPHILDMMARVANPGMKATWYQKWLVHRRLRPEEFGGHVHNRKLGAASYPIEPKLLNSQALQLTSLRNGSYLLPMSYPEGCPTHPAFPSGHATIAGACVTVLKAYFKESFVIPSPVQASDDGLALLPYGGGPLTVGGELNKLASNVAIGRVHSGVHWRSDGVEGMKVGEAVAISIMQDYRRTFNEDFGGFTLTKFDGTPVTV